MNSLNNKSSLVTKSNSSYCFDRRIKLIPCHKDKVRMLYSTGQWSMYALARVFRVSPTLIQTIVDPDYAERQKACHKGSSAYYDTRTHSKRISAYRKYKKTIARKIDPSLPRYKRKKQAYMNRSEYEKHQSSVCLIREGSVFHLHSTYCRRSGSLKAQERGIVPKNAVITTWGRLRAYRENHPEAIFCFEL